MSKAVSRGQALELQARFGLDTDWESLDGDAIQRDIVNLPRDELGRRFTVFLANGARLFVGTPRVISIEHSVPFDPAAFIGEGWTIWRGPADGDGLEGEEEQDTRSLALAEIDPAVLLFEHMLKKNESTITGEEKIRRLVANGLIRLDARVGQALVQEPSQRTLEWLYRERNISWFDLPGTVLRGPSGRRHVLSLCRRGRGWDWDVYWLGRDWRRQDPSAVLASS